MSGGSVLRFGKLRGSTFQHAAENCPDYCRWALSQTEAKGQLKEFCEFLRACGRYHAEASRSLPLPVPAHHGSQAGRGHCGHHAPAPGIVSSTSSPWATRPSRPTAMARDNSRASAGTQQEQAAEEQFTRKMAQAPAEAPQELESDVITHLESVGNRFQLRAHHVEEAAARALQMPTASADAAGVGGRRGKALQGGARRQRAMLSVKQTERLETSKRKRPLLHPGVRLPHDAADGVDGSSEAATSAAPTATVSMSADPATAAAIAEEPRKRRRPAKPPDSAKCNASGTSKKAKAKKLPRGDAREASKQTADFDEVDKADASPPTRDVRIAAASQPSLTSSKATLGFCSEFLQPEQGQVKSVATEFLPGASFGVAASLQPSAQGASACSQLPSVEAKNAWVWHSMETKQESTRWTSMPLGLLPDSLLPCPRSASAVS
eukprot:TRINITY_DN25992_c0_g1_i2.p1 TRINITY_DN25992_c0_g1~~TRINITY_DN25992_c0_g1_i2.p1  ORF type:complete len:436 (-),score=87.73 TRINITY_DN25992_c0_g1_i2:107-1414(-)